MRSSTSFVLLPESMVVIVTIAINLYILHGISNTQTNQPPICATRQQKQMPKGNNPVEIQGVFLVAFNTSFGIRGPTL